MLATRPEDPLLPIRLTRVSLVTPVTSITYVRSTLAAC
jgi:hypothetical protein